MRYLWLSREQAREIVRHATSDAPREACGIIGGVDDRARIVVPAPNTASDPRTTYHLDDATLARTIMQFRSQGLSLIGFYHSHPNGSALPSKTDIRLAAYPDTAYLIVGLGADEPELAAWRIQSGEVQRLPLHIGDEPPPIDETPLSPAQKVAIMVSALLAFAILLIISLSLLPPAPEILSVMP